MATATVQGAVPEHRAHAKVNGVNEDPTWLPTGVKDVTLRTDFSFDMVEESLDTFARGEAIVVMDD